MSNDLVFFHNNEAVTSTQVIASETDNDHASVIKMVRTYADDFRKFGLLDFKSESTRGRPTEVALLNERQATLLITYMRNNEVVREFKIRLVQAFYELANRAKQISAKEVLERYRQQHRNSAASNYNLLVRSGDEAVLWLEPELRTQPFVRFEKQKLARMKEADMLNELIIGMTAKKYRQYFKQHNVPAIRDYFPAKLLEAYDQAEILDATLIEQREPRSRRMETIEQMLKIRFPNVLMFRNVVKEQVRRIDFAEASEDDDGAIIHPAEYHELRADQELLDMLGVQDTLMLTDVWDDIESDRGKAYLGI